MSRRSTLSLVSFLIQALAIPHVGAERPGSYRTQTSIAAELQVYFNARSIVQMSEEELLRFDPVLKSLVFDANQDGLGTMLLHTAERVEALFRDLPNVASREDVRHESWSRLGHRRSRMDRSYQYLFFHRPRGFEESRTDLKGKPVELQSIRNFLLTAGYAGSAHFFHPDQLPGSRYRYLGKEKKHGELAVAFAQKPEAGTCQGVFRIKGAGEACLLFQGIAWIHPDTFRILRMRTALLAPRPDVDLLRQDTDIMFEEVRFEGISTPLWLPHEVVTTLEVTGGMTFRNRHRYSDFHVFTVESFEKIEPAAARPRP
jgi:hypothetical protein